MRDKGGVCMYCNIEAERARMNLSQDELVKRLGISRKTYYTWQMTGKIPSTKLIAMSRLFNCSTDYLLGLSVDRRIKQIG